MRNFHKKIACTLTGVMLCGTLMGAVPVLAKDAEKYTNTDFAMDTVVSETLYTTGDDLNAEIGNKLREIESGLLSWTDEDSQISKLNAAAGETTEVSDELAGYLAQIEQLADDSGGAFDPTLGKVIRLWDIDGEDPHVPEQSELEALLKDVGYQKVTLDGNKVTLAEDTTLDLGATGKGIGCDVISEFLKDQKEVEGMILNLGGSSVMTYGEKPDGFRLIVGRNTDRIRMNCFDTLGNTIWNNRLEILSEIEFCQIGENYYTDAETGKAIQEKRRARWEARHESVRRDLPDAFKCAALKYVQRQPRMKSCKLSDVTRVTRINRSSWGEVTPALYCYEIEARGKTFRLLAPRND